MVRSAIGEHCLLLHCHLDRRTPISASTRSTITAAAAIVPAASVITSTTPGTCSMQATSTMPAIHPSSADVAAASARLDETGIGADPEPNGVLGPRAVLVPVKAFGEAKRRLDPALPAAARKALAQRMAAGVLAAARPLPVAVVCDDLEVADWARRSGALVIWEPGRGLNGAVEAGVAHLASMGVASVVVAHSDLPRASGLGAITSFDGITLVPDRKEDGTNVIALPTRCGFEFSYGPGSFARHRSECSRLKIAFRVLRVPELALDIDDPEDLQWA